MSSFQQEAAARQMPASIKICDNLFIFITLNVLITITRILPEYGFVIDNLNLVLRNREYQLMGVNCITHVLEKTYSQS